MLNIDNSSWQLPLYQIKIVFEFSIFRTKLPCTLFAFYLGFDACAPLAYKNSELSCCINNASYPLGNRFFFSKFCHQHPGTVFTAHISYLEIYNENGYDLLDPKHEACKLEDLP